MSTVSNDKKEDLMKFLVDEPLITTFVKTCIKVSKEETLTEDTLYTILEETIGETKYYEDQYEDFNQEKRAEEAEHRAIEHGENQMQDRREDNG